MTWGDFKELEKKFPGVEGAYQKLKECQRLQPADISLLHKFINDTVYLHDKCEENVPGRRILGQGKNS